MCPAIQPEPKRDDAAVEPPQPAEPTLSSWRRFRRDAFWRSIPAWSDLPEADFLDHRWQEKNAVTRAEGLRVLLGDRLPEAFLGDVEAGIARAPMSLRLSPYLIALIDWERPRADPIRRQFLPLASEQEPDHPLARLDSLGEQDDAPLPGLIHRYPTTALFLPLDSCPVYCRFCTRSYAVGLDTQSFAKANLRVDRTRWEAAFDYVRSRPELEDIVVSGGDAYRLNAMQLTEIGERLLALPNVARLRIASKGPAVQPMKILTDAAWREALLVLAERGRAQGKEIALHTHFNHPREITGITAEAMGLLFRRGLRMRNQSVLLRGVNDEPETLIELCRRLGAIHVEPYYVYLCDPVPGSEDQRTTLAEAIALEKALRGSTAGYNTPTFVVDLPGGGGKRDLHSYERYDRTTGIAVYRAPAVKPGQRFLSADPLRALEPAMRAAWDDPREREAMVARAHQASQ